MRLRSSRSARAGRRQLFLQALEPRDVPAGNITAAISPTGVLSLTGDDLPNAVTLKVEATRVTLSPDSTTQVNGQPAGNAVVLPGEAHSLKAALKGGADILSIDAAADFVLTGTAAVDMGGGANGLDLVTTGKIGIGGLSFTSKDGATVDVRGGAGKGSTISGPVILNGGAGSIVAILGGAGSHGELAVVNGGVRLSASAAGSQAYLEGSKLSVQGAVQISSRVSSIADLTASTVGGLTASGWTVDCRLQTTTVNGNVVGKSRLDAIIESSGSNTITGDVRLSGPYLAYFRSYGVAADTVNVAGDITLVGGLGAVLHVDTVAFQVHDVLMQSRFSNLLDVEAGTWNATGDVSLLKAANASVTFQSIGLSQIQGAFTVTSGSYPSEITISSNFQANGPVRFKLGDANNGITIGDTARTTALNAGLSIRTGSQGDQINLIRVSVLGPTTIASGKGEDGLVIDGGSKFTGMFMADLGAGDDAILIARNVGSPAPVTFIGMATILGGDGDDTLRLGNSGGDANSKAAFAAGSVIDGGKGYNSFDDELGLFTGVALGTDIVNWFDPTP